MAYRDDDLAGSTVNRRSRAILILEQIGPTSQRTAHVKPTGRTADLASKCREGLIITNIGTNFQITLTDYTALLCLLMAH